MPDVAFGGETFRTAESIGLMALMRFAYVAKTGTDANDLSGLVAMYELLEQCIHEDDWDRFQATALRTKAKGDELMGVVREVIAILGRPESAPKEPTEPEPHAEGIKEPEPAGVNWG